MKVLAFLSEGVANQNKYQTPATIGPCFGMKRAEPIWHERSYRRLTRPRVTCIFPGYTKPVQEDDKGTDGQGTHGPGTVNTLVTLKVN